MRWFNRRLFALCLLCSGMVSPAVAEVSAVDTAPGTFPEASTLLLLCLGIAGLARFLWKSKLNKSS